MRPMLAAAVALPLLAAPAAGQDPFRWNGRLAAGQQVEVAGIAADMQVGPGSQVEVVARGLHDGTRVEVVEHAGGVAFCIVPPGMRRGRGADRCELDGNAGERWRRRAENVEVTVRLPAGVRLVARTVSGDVRAEGLRGDVDVRSVSGSVRVSTTGQARARSVSGDVRVRMGSLPRGGTLEFASVSGDVELTLPAGADADLRASTVSGDIRSDFPVEVERRGRGAWNVGVGERARGTLGRGGVNLELQTVSGDIRLARG